MVEEREGRGKDAEEERVVPSPHDLFARRPGGNLWVCGVEEWKTYAVGPGAKPQGVWRLSPEDEAQCYINVQILTLSRKKLRFNGEEAGRSCRRGRYELLGRPALPAQGGDGRSTSLNLSLDTTPTTALTEVICCLNCGFCK